jgi:hypothetical protein
MRKRRGKSALERDHIELSEEGYKRLIEMEKEANRKPVKRYTQTIDIQESIRRSTELIELLPRDIDKVSSNDTTYRLKTPLRVMMKKTECTYHAYAENMKINGFGFSSREAFDDFEEILTNAIVMVFNGEPMSAHSRSLIEWIKNNVEIAKPIKVWVHVITSDSKQAIYIDGAKTFEDDRIDAVDTMNMLQNKLFGEAAKIDFTYEDIDWQENDSKWTYEDMLPDKISRENFDYYDQEEN